MSSSSSSSSSHCLLTAILVLLFPPPRFRLLLATRFIEYDNDHDDGRVLHSSSDAGILSSSSSSTSRHYDTVGHGGSSTTTTIARRELQFSPTPVPPAEMCGAYGYVDCVNGFVRGDSTTTCETACGGSCCVGQEACRQFTGKVCRDGSCGGSNACVRATIPWVVNSCTSNSASGGSACFQAGAEKTNIGAMVNSCQGWSACFTLGGGNVGGCRTCIGKVGEIRNSCLGDLACKRLSYAGGQVGNIMSSCKGVQACENVADKQTGRCDQGNLEDQCNGQQSCYNGATLPCPAPTESPSSKPTTAGQTPVGPPPFEVCGIAGYVDCDNGFVRGDSTTTCETACDGKCCTGRDACLFFTGKVCKDGSCEGGSACAFAKIPWVVNSCISIDKRGMACYRAGETLQITNMVESCQGFSACSWLGSVDQRGCRKCIGKVGEIRDSCIGNLACKRLSYAGGRVGNIIYSCQGSQACESVASRKLGLCNQGDLVKQCNSERGCFKAATLPTNLCPTPKAGKTNKKAKSPPKPKQPKPKPAKEKETTVNASLFN